MLSGYLDDRDPPVAANALLTDFQDLGSGIDAPEAWPEFELTRWPERRPATVEPTLVQRVGNWPVMEDSDEAELRQMLLQRKPARAIVGKGVDLVRHMADRPAAGGTIGKQLTSIVVPRSCHEAVESGYHSAVNRHELAMADCVVLLADDIRFCMRDAKLENHARPIVVPKVGRNRPCPCGSGRKYKRCHGR